MKIAGLTRTWIPVGILVVVVVWGVTATLKGLAGFGSGMMLLGFQLNRKQKFEQGR